MPMLCARCQRELPAGSKFCLFCGTAVPAARPAASRPASARTAPRPPSAPPPLPVNRPADPRQIAIIGGVVVLLLLMLTAVASQYAARLARARAAELAGPSVAAAPKGTIGGPSVVAAPAGSVNGPAVTQAPQPTINGPAVTGATGDQPKPENVDDILAYLRWLARLERKRKTLDARSYQDNKEKAFGAPDRKTALLAALPALIRAVTEGEAAYETFKREYEGVFGSFKRDYHDLLGEFEQPPMRVPPACTALHTSYHQFLTAYVQLADQLERAVMNPSYGGMNDLLLLDGTAIDRTMRSAEQEKTHLIARYNIDLAAQVDPEFFIRDALAPTPASPGQTNALPTQVVP